MATELTSYPVSPDAALRLMLRCDTLMAAFTSLRACFPAEMARIDAWEARLSVAPQDNSSVEDIARAGLAGQVRCLIAVAAALGR